MKRFAVTAAQGQCTNPLGIKRLPAHGKFRLLRVILRVLRRDKWLARDGQNCRGVLTVPFLALQYRTRGCTHRGSSTAGWSPESALPDRLPKRPGSPVKLRY